MKINMLKAFALTEGEGRKYDTVYEGGNGLSCGCHGKLDSRRKNRPSRVKFLVFLSITMLENDSYSFYNVFITVYCSYSSLLF